MASDYVSLAEAAIETGISRQAIWKKLLAGEIKSTKVGKTYIIPYTEIQKLRRTRLAKLEKDLKHLREREKAAK